MVLGFALIGHDIARKEKIRARLGVTSVTFEMPTIKEDTSYLQIWLRRLTVEIWEFRPH